MWTGSVDIIYRCMQSRCGHHLQVHAVQMWCKLGGSQHHDGRRATATRGKCHTAYVVTTQHVLVTTRLMVVTTQRMVVTMVQPHGSDGEDAIDWMV